MSLLNKPGPLEIEKTPAEWERALDMRVLDPDGWRDAGVSFSEPVNLRRFRELCATSTITIHDTALWG